MSFLVILCLIPLVALVVKSDVGQAIADAIRHNSGAAAGASTREIEELRGEVEHLRGALDEIHGQLLENAERLDFAERMLTKGADSGIPSTGGGA